MGLTIPLRVAAGFLCAVIIFAATATMIGVAWTFSLSAVRNVGLAHVATLANTARGTVTSYYQRVVDASVHAQETVSWSDFESLTETTAANANATFLFWQRYLVGVVGLFNYTLSPSVEFYDGSQSFADSNATVQVLAFGARRADISTWSVTEVNLTTREVTYEDEFPYVTSPPNLASFGVSYAVQDSSWSTVVVPHVGAVVFVRLSASLVSRHGTPVGIFTVQRPTVTIDGFLAALPRSSGTQAVLLDEQGVVVASSVLFAPTLTEVSINRTDNRTFGKLCNRTSPTSKLRIHFIVCRMHLSEYSGWSLGPHLARHAAGLIAAGATSQVTERIVIDGSSFYVSAVPIRTFLPSGAAVRGLGHTLLVAMPEEDVLGDVVKGRNYGIAAGAGVFVVLTLLQVTFVSAMLRSVRQISERMKNAAREVDAKPLTTARSVFSEVRDIEDSYERMRCELNSVMKFVPQTAMTAMTVDGKEGEISDFSENTESAGIATGQESQQTELEASPIASALGSRTVELDDVAFRPLQVSRHVFAADVNSFQSRRCTLVFVTCFDIDTQSSAALASAAGSVLDNVIGAALKNKGVVESMDPSSALFSFNAHGACHLHEDCAARFVLAIRDRLPASYFVAVDTSPCFVGTVGAHGRNARIVLGEAVDVVKRLPSLMRSFLETNVLFTERCARNVRAAQLTSTDRVAPAWTQPGRAEQLVVCALEDTCAAGEAFKTALGHLCRGVPGAAKAVVRSALAGVAPGSHDPRLLRLLATSAAVSKACGADSENDSALCCPYARAEAAAWQASGQIPRSVVVDASGVERGARAAKALVGNVADRLSRVGEGAIDDSCLFGMIADAPEPDEPAERVENSSTNRRRIVAADGTVWLRSNKAIGGGSFAKVYEALGETGETCAVKAIDLTNRHLDVASLAAEVEICSQLRHANVVSYVSCAHDDENFYILTEYVPGGSLRSKLDAYGGLSSRVARRFAVSILQGLQHLHVNQIVHCDLKPHNVLFGTDGAIKLTDFGSSLQLSQAGSSGPASEAVSVRGTAWYVAPEVARGEEPTPASDMWSFAITILEVLLGEVPWTVEQRCGNKESQFVRELGKNELLVPAIPNGIPDDLKATLVACVQRDPKQRPMPADILATHLAI